MSAAKKIAAAGIAIALAAVMLCEPPPVPADVEIATRLALALWREPPDKNLIAVASSDAVKNFDRRSWGREVLRVIAVCPRERFGQT